MQTNSLVCGTAAVAYRPGLQTSCDSSYEFPSTSCHHVIAADQLT